MTNSNDSTDESSLTCLLVLVEMAASKLENNDNLMKLLTLAQLNASKLEYENDKMRELVKDIWHDACHFDDFWDYVHDDGTHYFESELPHYQERMRKLEIEVETDEDW